jgi:hypothetical protein
MDARASTIELDERFRCVPAGMEQNQKPKLSAKEIPQHLHTEEFHFV